MPNDQIQINEAELDPKIVEYFSNKYKPVIDKKDELLGSVSTLSSLKKEIEALGGLDAVKSLKQQADEAAVKAEQDRLAALTQAGKTAEIEEHYKKILSEKEAKITARDTRLVNREIDSAITAAIGDDGFPLLLTPHMRSRVQGTIDENGEVQITVKGASGNAVGEDGQPLTLASLVAEFKANPQFAAAFKAPSTSGGGGRRNQGPNAQPNPFSKTSPNRTDQSRLIRENPALARTLAAEAGEKVDW